MTTDRRFEAQHGGRSLKRPPGEGITRLFLVRHGATPANERRPYILQGSGMDLSLSENGQRQAALLAKVFAEIELAGVVASPMRRACETAAPVCQHHGLNLETDERLKECSVGRWEGMDWESIRTQDPEGHREFFANPAEIPHPGGESFGDVHKRVSPAIQEIFAKYSGRNVLVVAHNLVNRAYLASFVHLPLAEARKLHQANCCINVLEAHPDRIDLITFNSTLHLD